MPALFKEGVFANNTPAWHQNGKVMAGYPTIEEAKEFGGHDFIVTDKRLYTAEYGLIPGRALHKHYPNRDHPEEGAWLANVSETYGIIQNDVMYDLAYAVVGEGARIETAVTLGKTGNHLALTLWLDEPITIPGDNSPILPYGVAQWHHGDGGASIMATSVRVVCANTAAAAYSESGAYETVYKFKHSQHVMEQVKDAKETIQGLRGKHAEYIEQMKALAKLKVTMDGREQFLDRFAPLPTDSIRMTDRVVQNIEDSRAAIRSILDGPTVPDAHRFTAYGLHLAGVEFLDHTRAYNTKDSYTKRCLIRPDKAKAKLGKMIAEVVAA